MTLNPEINTSPTPEDLPVYRNRHAVDITMGQDEALRRLILNAKKHVWLVILCTLLGVFWALFKNHTSPKIFTSTALIQLTQDTANQFRLQPNGSGFEDIDGARILTEIQILRSTTLALQTIESLHLDSNKDFAVPPPGKNWDLNRPKDRHALIANFLANLVTNRYERTNIISIGYRSQNPALAAAICNKLIENYTEHNFKDNYASTEQVSTWLQTQLGALRSRLEASQQRLLAMQKTIGIVGMDVDQKQSIVLARLEEFNRDLAQAEANRMLLQAKLIALKTAEPGVVDTLAANSVIPQLRQRKAALAEEYTTASSKYGPDYPRIVSLRKEMALVDQSIQTEEANVVKHAENEVQSATTSEDSLRKALQVEKEQSYATSSTAVEYTLARQEYESNRELYQGLEARLAEAGILASLHSSTSRIIESADVPDSPSSPRTRFNLGIGTLVGFALGVLIAIIISLLDTNVKTIGDVEEKLGLPMLSVIPKVDQKQLVPADFIAHATSTGTGVWSHVVEAYRVLRTSILLSRPGSPPKIIMVSSAEPGEGKSSISSLAAVTLALGGARVLLIDADLRRPTQHLRFGVKNDVGLSLLISGKSSLEESLYTIPELATLTLLRSGPPPPMPAELLGSPEMTKLLETLRRDYDFIILDTPPVLTVTDGAVLGVLSDGVLLSVKYGATKHNAVNRAIETLLRNGSQIMGAVVNAIDEKSADYAAYYGSSYERYYATDAPDTSHE